LKHHEGFQPGLANDRAAPGHEIGRQEYPNQNKQLIHFRQNRTSVYILFGKMAKLDSKKKTLSQHSKLGGDVVPENGFHATEKVQDAGRGQAVVNLDASFVGIDDAGVFQKSQVLGNGGGVGADQVGELADAPFAFSQLVQNKEPGGVGHGLHDSGSGFIFSFGLNVHVGHPFLFGNIAKDNCLVKGVFEIARKNRGMAACRPPAFSCIAAVRVQW
jgi:hypothetical protein